MERLLIILALSFFFCSNSVAQSVIVNQDGTHSTVINNGSTSTIVNPDGTHSTVDNTATSLGGTDSVKVNIGDTISIARPDKKNFDKRTKRKI